MGGLTSKYLEEVLQTPPRNTHVLNSDPRSPSDDITRTPIAVTDTPERNGTPGVKVLPFDPRSPTTEVNRTPLVVETKDSRKRPFSLKPSRLLDPEPVNTNEDSDPRSPTSRVPRTPLSDQTHTFTNKEVEEEKTDSKEKEKETKKDDEKNVKEDKDEENEDQEPSVSTSSCDEEEEEASAETTQEKVRLALSGSNKGSTSNKSNPRGMLQARQCRAIEEEYSKNQHAIMTQLTDQENQTPPPSNTQFVENI